MFLHQRLFRRLALKALAPVCAWGLVGLGGGAAAVPAAGLAWIGWQLETLASRWELEFQPRAKRMRSQALRSGGYFASVASLGAIAGAGWAIVLAAGAFWALSLALEGLEAKGPGALWGVAALAWLGPALPPAVRIYSAPSSSVDEWLPVLGLSAIYVPIAALLIGRGSRP